MAPRKTRPKPAPAGFFARWLGGLEWLTHQGLLLTAMIVLLIGAAIYGWVRLRTFIVSDPRFLVTAENIEVHPEPPSWVHGDVKSEVLRGSELVGISILDPQATEKIGNAFSVHTWVESVQQVRKQSDPRVIVELEYRAPVAMVEVYFNEVRGLLPVDRRGVLLPPDDFSPSQASSYLRISAAETQPTGMVGSPWGDVRVEGAAEIAAAWGKKWTKLKLYRIHALETAAGQRTADQILYEITTKKGAHIIWGRGPGHELSGEATASEKIHRLVEYVKQHGPLDDQADDTEIDLRDAASLVRRTARRDVRKSESR